MRKALILLATTALISTSTLAYARDRDRDRDDRPAQTTNQMINEAAARTARMKVELRLTTDQEKNWPAFESAMRDLNKNRIDRFMTLRGDGKDADDSDKTAAKSDDNKSSENTSVDNKSAETKTDDNKTDDKTTTGMASGKFDLLDRVNREADMRIARANDWKKLSNAAKPLYDSLDKDQKRRFAEILFHGAGERHHGRKYNSERRYDRNQDRDHDRDSYRDQWDY
ncbi:MULTISPECIES: Spy/CpxP family protein refolding chaperone [Rhodopseudomonas]|uniref:Spy/CpxP family protein refolding chaperone n=1 Tax=Rhodopseudomonas TaxID=1073 RepID=UPI000696CA6C|nr:MULTISPECIES: Spy/CpxP family protein refolding chaperone [Rhodopseudomonas]MDF3812125.1 Spy/CpxP family protein refolding chaperone [Rhodopseudomonas sp. BAL398]WOK19971.1 Spy/CpxP family protein refolding chaperone [Rhodopseudomonas sp. BAL398]